MHAHMLHRLPERRSLRLLVLAGLVYAVAVAVAPSAAQTFPETVLADSPLANWRLGAPVRLRDSRRASEAGGGLDEVAVYGTRLGSADVRARSRPRSTGPRAASRRSG